VFDVSSKQNTSVDPQKCIVSFNMSSTAEALENLSASLSLLFSEADTVMRRENAQPSMLSYYLARIGDQFVEIERCTIGLLRKAGS